MRQLSELERVDRESRRELMFATLMQDLMDFDAAMKHEYGHGYGRVQDWVFARLGIASEDRGSYIRMMETLDLAMDEGNGAIRKLDLRLSGDNGATTLVYTDKRCVLPMVVSEVDEINVQYWLRFPSRQALLPAEQKYIYHLGKRGVDGLLEHLGLGAFGIQEKFGLLEWLRHWWERGELARSGTTIWWVDGDRRSFVLAANPERAAFPTTTHFFQLGGGFWGSKPVSLEEAAALGQKRGRKIDIEQMSFDELD